MWTIDDDLCRPRSKRSTSHMQSAVLPIVIAAGVPAGSNSKKPAKPALNQTETLLGAFERRGTRQDRQETDSPRTATRAESTGRSVFMTLRGDTASPEASPFYRFDCGNFSRGFALRSLQLCNVTRSPVQGFLRSTHQNPSPFGTVCGSSAQRRTSKGPRPARSIAPGPSSPSTEQTE